MISDNVIIMTKTELHDRDGERFQAGCKRGRYDCMAEMKPELDKLTKRVKELEQQLNLRSERG